MKYLTLLKLGLGALIGMYFILAAMLVALMIVDYSHQGWVTMAIMALAGWWVFNTGIPTLLRKPDKEN